MTDLAERVYDLQMQAQAAAERRLAQADLLFAVEQGETLAELDATQEDYDAACAEMAGPWCGGCPTCVVREVLSAAWPFIQTLAEIGVTQDQLEQLSLQPGDILVLRPAPNMPVDTIRAMATRLGDLLPDGVRGAIVPSDIGLEHVSKDKLRELIKE
jgi:hypothetical protein